MVRLIKVDPRTKLETKLETTYANETDAQKFVDQETLERARAREPLPWPHYRIVAA